MLGNFEFTYTSAGNLHTQVLANAIANFPIHGKYIPLTKNNENIALVISYHKKIVTTSGCKSFILSTMKLLNFFCEKFPKRQIFYDVKLPARVVANSYHKKFAKLTGRGCNFFML